MKVEFTKEYINSIDKIIDSNGCWIPTGHKPFNSGYIMVGLNHRLYLLHRISMCVYNGIDYDNKEIETRHGKGCSKACFNYEHLKPGSRLDNGRDMIEHGTCFNSNKIVCPSCKSPYSKRVVKSGPNRGKIQRFCRVCVNKGRWEKK